MRRASPRIRVEDFDLEGVTSTTTDPSEGDAISLSNKGVSISGGFATPINAVLPDKADYQRLRFQPADVDFSGGSGSNGTQGAPTSAEITIWERTADGEMLPAGISELQDDGTWSAVEIDNHDARYLATVTTLEGDADEEINVGIWVQGVHTPTYIATDGA